MAKKSRKHNIQDVLDMDQLKLLSSRSVLVGGTAIAIMLGPEKVSHPLYLRSSDVDVVLSDSEALRLSKSLKCDLMEENMIDRHLIKLGDMEIEYKSPFTLMRINDYNMDIFTPSTGLGPISIDDNVFDNAIKCKVGGLEMKLAHPSYIMATTLNPLVATDERIKRSFLVISEYVQDHGSEAFFNDVLKPAITYMRGGSKNVKKVLSEIKSKTYKRGNSEKANFNRIFKQRKKSYFEYEAYLEKTMPRRLDAEKGKIAGFVTRIGIGTRKENIRIVADVASFLRKA
jgi:hypothetical protein